MGAELGDRVGARRTDLHFRAAKPGEREYRIGAGGGLYLHVATTGRRTWRLKYRREGKEHRIVFGAYPDISLKRARELRDETKSSLRAGRDPKAGLRPNKSRAAMPGESFEEVARAWHRLQSPRWKPVHAEDVITSMERDLFPAIGATALRDIDEPTVLAALRKVEERGAIETARRLRQRVERIFKFGKGAGLCSHNPAVDVRESMTPLPARRRWPALLDLEQLRRLVTRIDTAAAAPVTRLASRFLALTAQRPGMVRQLPWHEIEGVDWSDPHAPAPAALWRVPAARVKQELDLREDDAFEHLVPLSRQSVEVVRAIHSLTGRGPLVFPSGRSVQEPMSENAIGYLYNREGYKDRHVPHGWRSSFSTLMNAKSHAAYGGSLREHTDRLIIDLMLAHLPRGLSETELVYNRNAYMPRRREIAQDWADMLLEGMPPAVTLVEGRRRRPAN